MHNERRSAAYLQPCALLYLHRKFLRRMRMLALPNTTWAKHFVVYPIPVTLYNHYIQYDKFKTQTGTLTGIEQSNLWICCKPATLSAQVCRLPFLKSVPKLDQTCMLSKLGTSLLTSLDSCLQWISAEFLPVCSPHCMPRNCWFSKLCHSRHFEC